MQVLDKESKEEQDSDKEEDRDDQDNNTIKITKLWEEVTSQRRALVLIAWTASEPSERHRESQCLTKPQLKNESMP